MARGRAATILSIVILAVACLRPAAGVKVQTESASLNETVRHDDDVAVENALSLSNHESENRTDVQLATHDHPHRIYGKPTKFDMEPQADDKADYQIESTRIDDNVTASPIETNATSNHSRPSLSNSTGCGGARLVSCIRRDFMNFLDRLSRVDTYNITESMQIVKNPETEAACDDRTENDDDKAEDDDDDDDNDEDDDSSTNLLGKVHRYAKTHVMKIRLNKDPGLAGKARTFFGCEFP